MKHPVSILGGMYILDHEDQQHEGLDPDFSVFGCWTDEQLWFSVSRAHGTCEGGSPHLSGSASHWPGTHHQAFLGNKNPSQLTLRSKEGIKKCKEGRRGEGSFPVGRALLTAALMSFRDLLYLNEKDCVATGPPLAGIRGQGWGI